MVEKKDYHIMNGHDEAVKANRHVKQKRQTDWNSYIASVRNFTHQSHIERLDKYLEHFCEENKGCLKEFKKYFKDDHLKSIEKRWKVLCSEDGLDSLD